MHTAILCHTLAGLSLAGLLLLGGPGADGEISKADTPASDWSRQANGGTIAETAYWRLVEHSLERLALIEASSPDAAARELAAIVADWQVLRQVALEDGTVVTVGHDVLLAALTADPPDLAAARSLLQSMQQAGIDWPAARHDRQALDPLRQILSRDEFHWESGEPGRLRELLNGLRERLLELWYGALERGLDLVGANRAVRWALFIVAAAILIWAIARAARRLAGGFIPEITPDAAVGEAGALLSAQEALRKAQELSQAGDYRSAVRYLYMSSLISLEEQGVLRRDRSRTNREYLRMLADRPEVAERLREVVEVFDRVWYGFQRLDQASFARYAERVEALRRRG